MSTPVDRLDARDMSEIVAYAGDDYFEELATNTQDFAAEILNSETPEELSVVLEGMIGYLDSWKISSIAHHSILKYNEKNGVDFFEEVAKAHAASTQKPTNG